MDQQTYSIGDFAKKAMVTIRTLRYYDRQGILSPSSYTGAGYRRYSDHDLSNLQYILALKFLGFSLDEIKICLTSGPIQLKTMLTQQKRMLREKQKQLKNVLQVLEQSERVLQQKPDDWQALLPVIQVLQMEQKKEWVDKYLTPEQQAKLNELSQQSYSESASAKLASRSVVWTEADQIQADEQWAKVGSELTRLTALNVDPAGPEAQELVKLHQSLIGQFTQGDPEICAGLQTFWQSINQLPEDQRPINYAWWSKAETEFLNKALEASKA